MCRGNIRAALRSVGRFLLDGLIAVGFSMNGGVPPGGLPGRRDPPDPAGELPEPCPPLLSPQELQAWLDLERRLRG